MRISWLAFSSICCLFTRVWGAEYIPDCSLTCLGTIVPEICGSLTNVTCLCTNVVLAAELLPCIATACNVTDSLAVEKYQADTCGVKADRTRLNEQLRLYYIMPALTVIFVALRFAARLVVDVGIKADDYMMLAAEIAFLADVGTGLVMTLNDFGEHTYSLTTHQLQTSLKFFYISELFYIVTLTFTKLSLLLFFRRIFPNQKFNQAVWIVMGFVATSNFSMLMALTFQCLPFHGNWTNWMYKVAPVKCINSYAAIFTLAGLSIAHDLIILIMPLPTLWSLHLAWQKKLNLLVMFSIGSFVIVCSLIRLPSLLKLQKSSDPSYDQAPIAVWTHLEQSVGIICGCLPACRSLVGWAFPGLKMKLESSKETSKYGLGYSKNSKVVSRTDRGDRDFIELDEQLSEENGSERGRAMSVKSQESQIPFGDSLVPAKGKNMGSRTYVNVTEKTRDTSRGRHQRRELSNGGEAGGITLTTSVYLTEQRSGPGR